MAECVHAIPGRARFRVPALRHGDTVAQALHRRLSGVPGIHQVIVRQRSASIIVHHDPAAMDAVGIKALILGEIPDAPPPPASAWRRPAPATATATAATTAAKPACRTRQVIRYVSGVAGAAALNTILERAVKAGLGAVLRSARIPI